VNRIVAILAALAVAGSVFALTVLPRAVSSDSDDSDDDDSDDSDDSDSDDELFEIENFVGVSGPFLGSANAIRGVNGAGAAWVLDEIEAEVEADGTFTVEVEGLVLTSTGTNPVANFRAILSCLVSSGTTVTTSNMMTGLFPADTEGDAEIRATLTLPATCVAPIVFVTSPGGSWFAASGF